MATTLEQRLIFRDLLERPAVISHHTCEMILRLVNVHILEMEDVLFHHNSAVMMPSSPSGRSATDGTEDDSTDAMDTEIREGQERMSGIRALSVVFRQFEFDPDKRMIIAGHTDTSGGVQLNFDLSDLRAQNVLYLLTGDKEEWARICYERHKVEDYQQIMLYVHTTLSWPCDPQGVDDRWGPNTEDATREFINSYNSAYAPSRSLPLLATDLTRRVANDGRHRWPLELWEAVYEIYSDEMARALEVPRADLDARRSADLRFVDDSTPYVGCGESFPIDDAEKDNYRSQSNRRVEILFFDRGEEPEINCPAVRNRKHEEEECPLWHGYHFLPVYIDPNDLTTMVFHLRFDYYDRVRQEMRSVPEIGGLTLRGFERRTVGATEQVVPVPTTALWRNDVWYVRLRFTDALSNHPRDRIHFEFTLPDRWIYTQSRDSQPEIRTSTAAAIQALPLHEQFHYYDLPAEWDSRNWHCSQGTTMGVFSQVVSQRTSPSSPLKFNLGDVVLVSTSGSQALTDRNGVTTAAEPHGAPQPLSDRSRVRMLHVDPADQDLEIFTWASDTDTDQQKYDQSLIRFETLPDGTRRNLLMGPPAAVRAVIFCGQFYDVASKRTRRTASFNVAAGHVLGARAAVLEDPDVHRIKLSPPGDNTPMLHADHIGDFEVHYLHGGWAEGTTVYSFLVVYWCAYVTKDTSPSGGTGDNRAPTDAEVDEFKSIGMANARDHWNKKGYRLEEEAGGTALKIRPYFFFEAFEEFSYTAPAGSTFTTDKVPETETLFASPGFRTAVRNARGGAPKSVIFVVEESKGSWMRSWRNATHYFSVMRLRIKTRQDDSARFTGFPFNEFGDPGQYGCLVIAHEIGHATGQVDDYMEKIPESGTRGLVPNFGQFGFTAAGDWIADDNSNFASRVAGSDAWAINHDALTMMDKNGPIRMRHVWRFTHWLNDESQTGGSLHGFLGGTRFAINYPGAGFRYYRTAQDRVNPWEFSHAATINAAAGRPVNVYINRTLDETRRKGATDFRAILSVRVLMAISYRDNGANTWDAARRKSWVERLYAVFLTSPLRTGYKLEGGGGNLDPTIIRFIPGFEICPDEDAPDHDRHNYHIIVRRNSNDAITRSGKTIELGDQIPPRQLVNYFFNKPAADATFAAADFTFVRTWFNQPSVGGGTFTLSPA